MNDDYSLVEPKESKHARRNAAIICGVILAACIAIFFGVYYGISSTNSGGGTPTPTFDYSDNPDIRAVQMLQNYLQIKTALPNPQYAEASTFLQGIADMYGFAHWQIEFVTGYPIVIMKVTGKNENLPSVVLYSHMDVVPVVESEWNYPPYGGVETPNGDIYGRGTQDMKSVAIQYIEAVHRIVQNNGQPLRNIYIFFAADEEAGGMRGAELLAKSEEWADLNVGIVFDEGLPSETSTYYLFYGQRSIWRLFMNFTGPTGHGSRFIGDADGSAVAQMSHVLSQVLEYRTEQYNKMVSQNLWLGSVTTVNPDIVQSGDTINVVPYQARLGVDMRISPNDTKSIYDVVNKWLASVPNVTYTPSVQYATTTNITNNKWYDCFAQTFSDLNLQFTPEIFPAGTDGSFFRTQGYDVLGFSPIANTPNLMHDHNEFINNVTFLEGIRIYEQLIFNLVNLE